MKIKILRGTKCGGKPVEVGAEVDASNQEARFLMAIGKAEAVADKPVKKAPAKKAATKAEA